MPKTEHARFLFNASFSFATPRQFAVSANSSPTPSWFRYAVIVAATLVLCSCRSSIDAGRLPSDAFAQQGEVVRGQSPQPELPTHLTPSQMSQASAFICDQPVDTGCACCGGATCPVDGPGKGDEYLCDGGDFGLPVGVRADWTVDGLEQEDTVAHYDTVDGRTVIAPSNQVCIYAPRFKVVRRVVDLREFAQVAMPQGSIDRLAAVPIQENEHAAIRLAQTEPTIHRLNLPPGLLLKRQQAGELDRDRRAAVALGSLAPSIDLQVVSTGEVSRNEKVGIARASLAAIAWTANQGPQVTLGKVRAHAEVSLQQPGVIYHLAKPNQPRLRLIKLASTDHAQPGDEVVFTLRFDNVGNRVIGNVTIVDNLTTRLEYIGQSQKSTVKSDFKTKANEGGSLILRWEINEPVEPGQGGALTFRCRVR